MKWIVGEKNLQQEKIVDFGNKFLVGNGYLGYRGTMEEYGKKEFTACILSGIYDQQGTAWREPINAPNGMYTKLLADGEPYDLLSCDVKDHNQQLDMRFAIHLRESVLSGKNNEVKVKSERFASAADYHLLTMNYSFSFTHSAEVQLITGIDGDVWDINGPHFADYAYHKEGAALAVEVITGELHHHVVTAETSVMNVEGRQEIIEKDKGIFRKISFSAKAGKTYTISKAVVVYTSEDVADPLTLALEESCSAIERGYDTLKKEHEKIWADYWEAADVIIEGDEEAQFALRYSIYQLLSIAPRHTQAASIPARGLSGQTYKGAVFWDTEMFMLPFFLYTDPEVGKNLMNYRIKTLNGARKKAAEYGFRGAFYAWESQENGQDACSDYNVTDVFTNRPMRTYFRDKQVHISADVAYGIWQVYLLTGDRSILLDGGAEVILECARFYCSFSYYKEEKERFELIDVIGPDEYHERVYNNAYTNKMAVYTIKIALETLELLKEEPNFYEALIDKLNYQEDLEGIIRLKRMLYVPEPDRKTGLIEQFDGYFNLEDTTVEEVRSRLINPKEYWGGAYGVASDTQIIKQADVVLLLNLFKEEYSQKDKEANWTYYEPRTEHGSSLSACIYAMQACDIGDPEWAYPYFMKTASVDLTGESKQFAGTIYIGGTHPAANGGAWMTAVLGFGGLKVNEAGIITVDPVLPEKWQKLSFKIFVKGQQYKVEISKQGSEIMKVVKS
ncbi:glycoside hydrolase family 65 protein [Enterococcus sp. BWB1-3]|uniref:glycoside hydrolase family 65 protein n=1 Tax=Enterococcus sp. BWB1-3 TaxID=2787713 RepID=UPI00192085DA|nr:glycoside hydrolase family 65 protein [Enterococcus sp. BWB1-3]MBL1229615.1 glycoside hydrolase family 65 protein [Enterococcus sp. BWB1-3]